MKTTMKAIFSVFLLASTSSAFAENGGGTVRIGPHESPEAYGQTLRIMTMPDQRMAFAKCMKETERLRGTIDQMPRIGSPWSRGRVSYSSRDLSALSDLREQFEVARIDLTTAHQEFRKTLTDVQQRELEQHLSKLDRLQAKMNSDASQLGHDLMAAKPGPASPNVSWDVNSIKRTIHKWRSEHRKIAKEMNIPK